MSILTSSQKLLAPNGPTDDHSDDRFGESVAIYGDTIVVGAEYDDYGGSAHVFVRSGVEWKPQDILRAPDEAAFDWFGFGVDVGGSFDGFGRSVAIYEDTIVAGAWSDDGNGLNSGSAHVFLRRGEKWNHHAKLLVPEGAVHESNFGGSVAIHKDTIVIGANGDDDNRGVSESAYTFVRDGELWAYQAELRAPDGAAADEFGESVAIHGDTIVVGAHGDDDNGNLSGSAHVFVRSADKWKHHTKLLAPNATIDDLFGWRVAIYGDTIVVGAKNDDDNGVDSGSAHVFVRSGEDWTHKAKLLAPDGTADDEFGDSVAIYEDTIVVGSHWDDDNGVNSGSLHVFVRSGETWTHQAKLLAPDGAANDFFGKSTAVYKDEIVVGAHGDDNSGDLGGSAYVFSVRDSEESAYYYCAAVSWNANWEIELDFIDCGTPCPSQQHSVCGEGYQCHRSLECFHNSRR